jgi:transcriptional regulator with PAS, ATPase and Fis domain
VIRVDLPPLRERKEDIPALCNYFLAMYSERYKSAVRALPLELMKRFVQHDWPGNVRELENSIRKFLVLPEYLVQPEPPLLIFESSLNSVADVERVGVKSDLGLLEVGAAAADRAQKDVVYRILEETNGNRKQAARRMNICYKALLNKLKRWETTKGRAA